MKNIEKYLNKFYDFIDKIGKHNFILIIFVFIVLVVTGLYQTFSLYTESEGLSILNGKDTYSFILDASNQTNSITIAAGASKNIDITIGNDSDVPLKYELYSSEVSNPDTNFIFGYSTGTKYLPNGVIPAKTSYIITLKVYNYSDYNQIIDFGIQYGFDNEENLTLSSGQYAIEPLYLMKTLFNTWDDDYNYYRAEEYRNKIVSASFVDIDTISDDVNIENAVMSWDVSINNINNDGVKAWIVQNKDNTNNYDLYIGAKEKIYADSLYALFSKMTALESVDFDNLDTSLATSMAFLFRECSNLKGKQITTNEWELDLSGFDTSNVTSMWSMFGKCTSISNIDVSSFDTSKVTNMKTMFYYCTELINLNLSNFNTKNVTKMTQMFESCNKLISPVANDVTKGLVLGNNFKTDNVTDMAHMFNHCNNLTSLDLSNFNTKNVKKILGMFHSCINLTELNISSFDTSNVDDFSVMFYDCKKLNTSIVIKSNRGIKPIYVSMFTGSATDASAKILLSYEDNTIALVKNMIKTKSSNSNVYISPLLLSEVELGSYVQYTGTNGCDNTTAVNGLTSCNGKNVNASSTSNGYCNITSYQFNSSGWRLAYVENNAPHLVSAGATDCICTKSDGTPSSNSGDCSGNYLDATNISSHIKNGDNIALKYCNENYAKDGNCNNNTAWAMDASDFKIITGTILNRTSCFKFSSTSCGNDNDLIDNNGFYWLMTISDDEEKPFAVFYWHPGDQFASQYNSSGFMGVRPVLALDPSVIVTGGSGTESAPYLISN